MTKTRTIGTLAAIGGVTATIALLTGLPAANADELADLRANQELLQRRIDQLAQGQLPPTNSLSGGPGSAYGAQPTPGVPVGGGSFPRSFLIPGTDTSIRVGGFIDLTSLYFLQRRQQLEPRHPHLQLRPKRQPEWDTARPNQHSGARPDRAVGQPFARQRGVHDEPAAIAAQRRDPHPDSLGRVADVYGVRLGRQQQFQSP